MMFPKPGAETTLFSLKLLLLRYLAATMREGANTAALSAVHEEEGQLSPTGHGVPPTTHLLHCAMTSQSS